jgi:histidine triad (HIT) family protein
MLMQDKSCLFCRIVADEIPAKKVYTDDHAVAFQDINPQAPVHTLIIPRNHIASLDTMGMEDETTIGHLLHVAAILAREEGIAETGYRTVVNTGEGAGQSVFHVHVHLLGGRQLGWPPG